MQDRLDIYAKHIQEYYFVEVIVFLERELESSKRVCIFLAGLALKSDVLKNLARLHAHVREVGALPQVLQFVKVQVTDTLLKTVDLRVCIAAQLHQVSADK